MIDGNAMCKARILMVDDDHLIRQMTRDLLEIGGDFVEEAVDGADALRQAAALAHHPRRMLANSHLMGRAAGDARSSGSEAGSGEATET